MNIKQVFAVLAVAMAGNVAMAAEATQFSDTPSTLSRAEVRAELARAQADGTLTNGFQAIVLVERPVASTVSRDEVRAQARAAAKARKFDALYAS
jgi:hypothetical protein